MTPPSLCYRCITGCKGSCNDMHSAHASGSVRNRPRVTEVFIRPCVLIPRMIMQVWTPVRTLSFWSDNLDTLDAVHGVLDTLADHILTARWAPNLDHRRDPVAVLLGLLHGLEVGFQLKAS
jgi:hypothetical protein